MSRTFSLFIVAVLLAATSIMNAQVKKRIAVAEFQDRSGHRGAGQGVADMLITALVKSGEFSVVERKELDKVLAEQRLGQSDLVTPQTAPSLGKLLGVDEGRVNQIDHLGELDEALVEVQE